MSRSSDIESTLEQLARSENLRELRPMQSRAEWIVHQGREYYNLSSNDYMGLSDTRLQSLFFESLNTSNSGEFLMSNPSSRLLTGNSLHYTALEDSLAQLFGAPAALVLSSGFLLNSGLIAVLGQKGDLLLCDKLVHASIIDGTRLSEATTMRYRHNDMSHLERLLESHAAEYRRTIVVTESIFSMDGDRAPLGELARLEQAYDFELYIDEAHAFGTEGTNGCGAVESYNATAAAPLRVDYLVATMGKALASQGAFVICSTQVRELLVNRLRTLIFSTALPPISLMWSRFLIERLPTLEAQRTHLRHLIGIMEQALGPQQSHIVPMHAGENSRALEISEAMREAGYWVAAIRHPTVPQGQARLRISLSAAHSSQKIKQFATLCKRFG